MLSSLLAEQTSKHHMQCTRAAVLLKPKMPVREDRVRPAVLHEEVRTNFCKEVT